MFFQFYTYIQIQKIQSTKTKTLQKPQTHQHISLSFSHISLGPKASTSDFYQLSLSFFSQFPHYLKPQQCNDPNCPVDALIHRSCRFSLSF